MDINRQTKGLCLTSQMVAAARLALLIASKSSSPATSAAAAAAFFVEGRASLAELKTLAGYAFMRPWQAPREFRWGLTKVTLGVLNGGILVCLWRQTRCFCIVLILSWLRSKGASQGCAQGCHLRLTASSPAVLQERAYADPVADLAIRGRYNMMMIMIIRTTTTILTT
eukprot:scaffold94435_cov33-Prasinocladus_malaysianus.AAC.1